MWHRLKHRALLIRVFLLQFLLFSIYTFAHYQNNTDTDTVTISNPLIISAPPPPDRLPASLIEKGDRSLINSNYRNAGFQGKNDEITYEKLQALNVSFVNDVDPQRTVIQCSILPSKLVGRIDADLFSYEMKEVEAHHANLSIQAGGHWHPSHCTARYRVAIVIPYRNREMQLRIFLNFMHPFLQKQQLDYQIFLIEPLTNLTFNRGLLFNIGFQEAMKHYAWQCFILHDVDLLPEDDRNYYSCPSEPRHMSVAVNTFEYELPYRTIFGGVSAVTVEQFKAVNGFSNQYFGWGAEDDDMAARVLTKYRISRYPASIARYKMLGHLKDTPNQSRFRLMELSSAIRSIDGLSNLQYTMIETKKEKLYTHIKVFYNETLIKSKIAHFKSNRSRILLRRT